MPLLILAILATYRVSRMIVYEDGPADVFVKFRGAIYGKFDPDHWIIRGFDCVLCVSFWVALIFAIFLSTGIVEFFVMWFGFSGGASALHLFLERDR